MFGAGGFVGREAVGLLRGAGHEVLAVAHRPDAGDAVADAADAASLAGLDFAPDAVVNLAARVPGGPGEAADAEDMLRANALAARRVAEWAAGRGARRLVHGSTLAVVARPWPVPLDEDAATAPVGPHAVYAASKLAGELMVRSVPGPAVAVLRFSALYGPGMAWHGVLPAFVDAARSGARPRVDAPRARADFLHVRDAARAVLAAVERPAAGVINVASGEETALADLARAALSAAGRSPTDYDVGEGGVASRALVSVGRARRELGWAAETRLLDGLRAVNAWRAAESARTLEDPPS